MFFFLGRQDNLIGREQNTLHATHISYFWLHSRILFFVGKKNGLDISVRMYAIAIVAIVATNVPQGHRLCDAAGHYYHQLTLLINMLHTSILYQWPVCPLSLGCVRCACVFFCCWLRLRSMLSEHAQVMFFFCFCFMEKFIACRHSLLYRWMCVCACTVITMGQARKFGKHLFAHLSGNRFNYAI